MYALNRLKFREHPFTGLVNLRMSSSVNFYAGRGTGVKKEHVGSADLGAGPRAIWPLYWCTYIVAGYRFVDATMKSDTKGKRKTLEELKNIYDVVENRCYPPRCMSIDTWRPPSSIFLTSRKPALKAAHLIVLVGLYKNWFGTSATIQDKPLSNALLCRMSKMIDVLHPYLAYDAEDLRGTHFEQPASYKNAFVDNGFEELKYYCKEATIDKKITARVG